jgi:hypothetical protein
MPEQPPHPAELPAESEGGSGPRPRFPRPGGIGGPNELPPPDWVRNSFTQLVREVFRLRNKIHVVESTVAAMRIGSHVFLPQELPEGEGGGGGGGFPPEIQEIVPPEIHELPINLAQEVASLSSRFLAFERTVLKQLEVITQRLDAMKR